MAIAKATRGKAGELGFHLQRASPEPRWGSGAWVHLGFFSLLCVETFLIPSHDRRQRGKFPLSARRETRSRWNVTCT